MCGKLERDSVCDVADLPPETVKALSEAGVVLDLPKPKREDTPFRKYEGDF